MFIRKKGNGFYLVENKRENGKVRQKVIQYLGVNPNVEDQYLPKINVIHKVNVHDLLQKLPDNSCDCIIADPPYFVSQNRVFKREHQKDINKNFEIGRASCRERV